MCLMGTAPCSPLCPKRANWRRLPRPSRARRLTRAWPQSLGMVTDADQITAQKKRHFTWFDRFSLRDFLSRFDWLESIVAGSGATSPDLAGKGLKDLIFSPPGAFASTEGGDIGAGFVTQSAAVK